MPQCGNAPAGDRGAADTSLAGDAPQHSKSPCETEASDPITDLIAPSIPDGFDYSGIAADAAERVRGITARIRTRANDFHLETGWDLIAVQEMLANAV